jgi:calcineurin-like phosphoesterase family protein
MSKVYAMGDLHFGHANAINWRTQFSTPEEHDETIFNNIMSTVTKRDTLWLLGDCFLSWKSVEYAEALANRVLKLGLVLGNHDTDNNERQKVFNYMMYLGLFDIVTGLKSHKGGVWLSHAPLHPCELRGKFNIHGHVHSNSVDDSRYFNASCEGVDYTPVNCQDALDKLKVATGVTSA